MHKCKCKFIQSDLQSIQAIHFFLSVHVFPGNRTHDLSAANAMLYHSHRNTYIILSRCLSIHQPFCVRLQNLISQLSFGSFLPWGIDISLCIYEWTYVSLHASWECKSLTIPPSFDRQSFKTGEPVLHNPSLTKFKLQVPTRLILWHK